MIQTTCKLWFITQVKVTWKILKRWTRIGGEGESCPLSKAHSQTTSYLWNGSFYSKSNAAVSIILICGFAFCSSDKMTSIKVIIIAILWVFLTCEDYTNGFLFWAEHAIKVVWLLWEFVVIYWIFVFAIICHYVFVINLIWHIRTVSLGAVEVIVIIEEVSY